MSGHQLSHPAPGDEVVITGISGSFPNSDSVTQLQENLFNKVDVITPNNRRWKIDHPEIPKRSGKINNLNKFDASFFGIPFKQAHSMDPMSRILLEKSYEAIIDAGVNPKELRNTKMGVFIGAHFLESEKTWLYDKMHVNEYGIAGCSRAMLANRISNWLGVTGPSYTVDTACASSLCALEHAFKAIRNGLCDTAIVGASNLCLHPYLSLQFTRLRVMSPDGRCKSFDNSANGYVRSEAIVVCFLQKAKDSRRVYAQVVYSKSNHDGYKEKGISVLSSNVQKLQISEFYTECSIPPNSIEFIEAHGTGTRGGDIEELKAIEEVFCTGRSKPLLIGSIKSNMGHSEPASGLCSIAKLCITYSTGYIPPNLNYKVPREGIAALADGRIKVVTEKQPWSRGMCAVNSYGFGGANSHALFKDIARSKVNNGIPSDDLPRLVCVSGRTESAVGRILDYLESRTLDAELVRLLHAIHDEDIAGHLYRGYTLLGSTPTKSVSLCRNIQHFTGILRPVWFVYSGMGSQWAGMATQLMRIPVFAAAIEKCHKVLEPKGINLTKIITDQDPKIYDNKLNSLIGIAAVQIGLTDVLKTVGIEPDFIIGYNVGELGCAYADGCFTAEQMILSAYSRGLAFIETPFIKGSMADVNLGHSVIRTKLPPEIEVAFYNGTDSSTIFGPADEMKIFVEDLVAQGILAQEVPCSYIAYHSRHIFEADPKPKPRSKRWLSTSRQLDSWKEPMVEFSSTEYDTNNFLSPVLFEETACLIPANAITIEITPQGLLQAILHRSLKKDVINIPLTKTKHLDNVQVLFTALGKLYKAGLNPRLANIFPTVQLPVSQGTPMLAHLVEWEHSEDWYVPSFHVQEKMMSSERTVRIYLGDKENKFLSGHVLDGRNLYCATGYLMLVWETLSMMMETNFKEVSVVFENVRILRATNIPKDGYLEFTIMIQKGSGCFEIVESGSSIATGRIYAKENVGQDYRTLPAEPESKGPNVKHLLTKDFYKELHLRGHSYSDLFRGIIECNVEYTRSRVAWWNNWVTFMDCMLQIWIISRNTRELLWPTSIEKLSIDTKMHYDALSKINPSASSQSFEIRFYPNVNVIRAGGVEIRGLNADPISKRTSLILGKNISEYNATVLEKNIFVANFGNSKMKIEDILRSYIQLILENTQTYHVKIIEIVDDEYKCNGFKPVMDKVANALGDMPLIQVDLSVISEDPIEMPSNITIENKKLNGKTNAHVLVGANLLQRPKVLKQTFSSLRNKGFIISREKELTNLKDVSEKYDIVGIQETGFEYMILFRKRVGPRPAKFIKIVTADKTYAWIDEVKEALKVEQKLVIYSQDEQINGLLGLIKCLKKEPGGENVHGLLIANPSAPPFNSNLEFYEKQLDKDLAFNVLEDGQWGTYRYLPLDDRETVKPYHAIVKSATIGDLSSLRWVEGPIRKNQVLKNSENILIHVYCAALNFRDVMIATGRLTGDWTAHSCLTQLSTAHGLEVVGRTKNGTRVMAIVSNGGMANMVVGYRTLMWSIPDEWTFVEAATVPVAYATAYYALVIIGQIQRGESILIHAGSGAVGQAAINVALHYGCEIFTTVGTPEKRAFIKKLYPQLKDSHIGNSRNTSFEDMIRKEMKGNGVDLVLNSLSADKLQASVRCLGYRGRFLEIGRFDMTNNTSISMCFFSKETSFHGIVLENIFECYELRKGLQNLLFSGIKSGAVRPLTYCTFEKHQVELAFRYLAAGKHIGKVIIKIRDEEQNTCPSKPTNLAIDAVPRYMCDPDLVYIVVGGLGGFGLELADWLIMRGARKVLLTSKRGISNGYQSLRLRVWANHGADVQISIHDITTEEGCEQMLKMANTMGTVEAIFNLAVVLKDCIFENQTPESFKISFAPKALATMNLDKLSKILCPKLKDFVVFSSVSCGHGNAGQTNYGFSNSVVERICERRRKLGLPALAVQWGAIGDVGLVAEMQDKKVQLEVGGTFPQSISSCLLAMDKFLKQDAVIVSSIVVAEKKAAVSGCDTIVDSVAHIIGIKDLETVPQQVSLADQGMDSIMAVEIKQTLERKFEIFLTAKDIRNLTFARLVELTAQREAKPSKSIPTHSVIPGNTAGLRVFMRNFGDETLASKPFIFLPTMVSDGSETDVLVHDNEIVMFMLPGLEGFATGMSSLCSRLKIKVCVLQFGQEEKDDTLNNMVNRLHKTIKSILNPRSPYILLGYSFGCLPIFKLAEILESEDHNGIVFCIDGSPDFIYEMLTLSMSIRTDTDLQNSLICNTINIVAPNNNVTDTLMDELKDILSFDERIQHGINICPTQQKYSNKFIESIAKASFDRIKMVFKQIEIKKIKAPIVLLRPKENPPLIVTEENYGLDKITEGPVTVHLLESDHVTIIENEDCANIINRFLIEQSVENIAQNAVPNVVEK